MRIAIVGSRTGIKPESVRHYISGLSPTDTIVSGGAKGVDSVATDYAAFLGMGIEIHPAEWDKYGKSAGFVRNVEIVRRSDRVVAFWDGESKGTKHSIDQALAQHKPLEVYFP